MPRLIRAVTLPPAVDELSGEIPLSAGRLPASIVLGSSCDICIEQPFNGIDGDIQRRQRSECDRSVMDWASGSAHPDCACMP